MSQQSPDENETRGIVQSRYHAGRQSLFEIGSSFETALRQGCCQTFDDTSGADRFEGR